MKQTHFEKKLQRLSKIQNVLKKSCESRFIEALNSLSGLWADRKDLPSTNKYVRNLRKAARIL
jgi:hypothetical protein